MPTFTHTASSGQFVAFLSDADGNVFHHRAAAFVAPAALVGREKEAAAPMSGPVDGVYTGETQNLPPGVYTANIFAASSGHLSQAALDGTLTPTATTTVIQSPPTRESYSTAVVSIEAAGSPTYNGAALLAAYEQAKLLTPNGAALSATNRAAVLVEPGVFDLDDQTLTLDTEFVDLIGLDESNTLITSSVSTVAQTDDDIEVAGVTIQCTHTGGNDLDRTGLACYVPDRNLPNAKLRRVRLVTTSSAHPTVYDATNDDAFLGTYEDIVMTGGNLAFQKAGGTFRRVRGDGIWGAILTSTARVYYCEGPSSTFVSKDASAKTLFCVVNNAAYANND